jgi:hypothetical protein
MPRSGRCGVREVMRSLFDQVLDESEAAPASIDVPAEFGIERDGSLQQDGRDGLVLEVAGAQERFIDGRQIVSTLTKRGANRVEVVWRRKEFERARKQAFTLKVCQSAVGKREAAQGRHRPLPGERCRRDLRLLAHANQTRVPKNRRVWKRAMRRVTRRVKVATQLDAQPVMGNTCSCRRRAGGGDLLPSAHKNHGLSRRSSSGRPHWRRGLFFGDSTSSGSGAMPFPARLRIRSALLMSPVTPARTLKHGAFSKKMLDG